MRCVAGSARIWLPVAALVSFGACLCVSGAGDKTYACTTDSECLDDFRCVAGFCASASTGGGSGGAGGTGGGTGGGATAGGAGGAGGGAVDGGCTCRACEVCDAPGFEGTCTLASAGTSGSPPCAPFVCNGTSRDCPVTCASDLECTGAPCVNGMCAPKPTGATCIANAECQTQRCVDGRCCDRACAGQCERCDNGAAPGICTLLPVGNAGRPPCGAYLCDGDAGVCPSTCAGDGDCGAQYYCDPNLQACVARRPNGSTCGSPGQCISGACADGFCCNRACSGGCEACNFAGDAGTCNVQPSGTDPEVACAGGFACAGDGGCHGVCTSPAQCEPGYLCFGGNCLPDLPNGAPCAAGTECMSGQCAQGVCCATACAGNCVACNVTGFQGTCRAAASGTDPSAQCPGGLACAGDGGCFGTCTGAAQCESGHTCVGGQCRKVNGQVCDAGADCQSTQCIDGVCCSSTCTGSCRGCVQPDGGQAGSCNDYPSGTDPGSECTGGLACTGSGSCRTSCTSSTHCEAGYYCASAFPFGGTCTLKKTLGVSCGSSTECTSGFCRDGVCCSSTCSSDCQDCDTAGNRGTCVNAVSGTDPEDDCGPAYACNGDGGCYTRCTASSQCLQGYGCSPAGTCLRVNGQTCSSSSSCVSGSCSDGRCCNAACSGACDACNLTGQLGVCTIRDAGQAGSPSCYPYVCSGSASCPVMCSGSGECVSGGQCVGGVCKRPLGGSCSLASDCVSNFCVDNTCCSSVCGDVCRSCNNGTGTCAAIAAGNDPQGECPGGFACNGSAACATTCTGQSDCEFSYFCSGGSCVLKLGLGGACTSGTQCQTGQCFDGVCCNTSCGGTCQACNIGTPGICTSHPMNTDPEATCPGGLACDGFGGCVTFCVAPNGCQAGFTCDAGGCQ